MKNGAFKNEFFENCSYFFLQINKSFEKLTAPVNCAGKIHHVFDEIIIFYNNGTKIENVQLKNSKI